MSKRIKENLNKDGVDRRGFLQCMAWAGTGAIWTLSGGVLTSKAFGQMTRHEAGASTPIVVFAHIPLWTVYPEWGWGTGDGAEALSYTKRFGSVTVLNGHIHQIMQKVEGNVSFHTPMSTAFPQPKPGSAPSPGPMKVPAEHLRDVLGITHVNYIAGNHTLAVIDSTLGMATAQAANFRNVADSRRSQN